MAFEYDSRARLAVDHERKIRLRLSLKFYDLDPDDFIFIYQDERMEFEFGAIEIMEVRQRTFRGNPVAQRCPVVTYVIEPELRRALMSALRGQTLTESFYAAMRKTLEDALLVLTMQGDTFLSLVPDYRVEFVQSVAAARRRDT